MENWIPFADGKYLTERAFLLSSANMAVNLDDTVIEVNSDAQGRSRMRGRGRIQNLLMVTLLDEADELDLVLDFGAEFKYRLPAPSVQAGKVFAANVKSMLQFYPKQPWTQLPLSEYEALLAQINFLAA